MYNRTLPWAWAAALAVAAPALLTPAEAAAARFGERVLRMNSHGPDVRVLQTRLTRLGFRATADCYFGRNTARAVRGYERRYDLTVDGRVSRAQARGITRRARSSRRPAGNESVTTPQTGDGDRAVLSADGRTAIAPASAPQAVKDAVAAANEITRKPYRYGGGHGSFKDSGYDCSGAVSYVLHGAGLLRRPRASSGFETYGSSGRGEWITVYANAGHAYVIVAGLRFDTSGRGEEGPRWRPERRSPSGYTVRHPKGY